MNCGIVPSSSSEQNELNIVIELLKLKNEKPEELARDQKFLTAAFGFLEPRSECIWCRYPMICGELLRLFSFVESPPLIWFREKTLTCLTSCRACIESYYGIRPKTFAYFRKVYDGAAIQDFEGKIYRFDVKRLAEPFECYLDDKDKEKRKKLPIKFILFEILLFPGWIVSKEVSGLFERVLEKIISSMKMVKISEKLPGVIVCSVHQNEVIRNWAKSVLTSNIRMDSNIKYLRINYSWDTVVNLSKKLDDEVYSDAIYMCLKSSDADFINSCANWEWAGRVFGLLKREEGFMESLRLFSLLMKILSTLKGTDWQRLTEFHESISFILDNPAFAIGPHTEQDSANFVLEWAPPTIKALLSDSKFKVAHKLISELMEFVLESRAPFSWKLRVAIVFSKSILENLYNGYLLGKLCQLLFFLLDKRFDGVRSKQDEDQIILSGQSILVALLSADLTAATSTGQSELINPEGTPSSACFDVSNYRKFLFCLESHAASVEFLNALSSKFAKIIRNPELSNNTSIWQKRIDFLSYFVKESISCQDVYLFSNDHVLLASFIYLYGLKLNISISFDQQQNLNRLVQNHPEKCLNALTTVSSAYIRQKFKTSENINIPIDKLIYFLSEFLLKAFQRDLEILKIYPDKNELVFDFFNSVFFLFYMELNYYLSLPGGAAFNELSLAISSFSNALIANIGIQNFQNYFSSKLSPSQFKDRLLPCLANLFMSIMQKPKSPEIPFLVQIGCELLILSGNRKVSITESRIDQILRVVLSVSSTPENYKKSITSALQEYNRLSGNTIVIPVEIEAKTPVNNTSAKMDIGMMRKLEALEKIEESIYIQQNMGNRSGATQKPPSTKLGQLKQEMIREGTTASGVPAKKSRFAPIVVQKAPRMMTQADLIRARADSSDSDSEPEISSETFKNAPSKPSTVPFTAQQAHRSVKLIDIDDEYGNSSASLFSGKPISSKASIGPQMQRDWQSAHKLHKYILNLDYSELNEFAIPETSSIQMIPESFDSYEKYLQIFEPLLQLECRAQIIQAKDEAEGRLSYAKGVIQNVSMVDDFHEIVVNFGDDSVHKLFSEQDLLVGHPVTHNHNPKEPVKEILGIVTQTSSRQAGFEVTIRFYMQSAHSSKNVEFQLLTRLKQAWKFAKLCNLVTNNREFLALQNLPLYASCQRILQPKFTKISAQMQQEIDRMAQAYQRVFNLNLPQASAILYALMNPNFFTLIQGPPGTGKTRTIEGFLSILFGRNNFPGMKAFNSSFKRIMICAPSNAAIDEIVRRLKGDLKDAEGRSLRLKIVRVGSLEMIHEDVKDLSIDAIVEKRIQAHIASAVEMLETNKKLMAELKVQLDKVENGDFDISADEEAESGTINSFDINTTRSNSNSHSLSKNLQQLKRQLWEVKENIRKGHKFIEDSRQNLRYKVLNEAQVVCCTLSASGHEIISRVDGDFEMVILDEACQAIELSALIPLQYGCKRAVLVGDPNQLPPTVISQMAVTFSYEQSLFQRLQKLDPSVVQLLSVQYRMHPEISAFPSSYFYGGRLRDGPNVIEENRRPWHEIGNGLLGPFRFFDIPGQEQLRTFSTGKQGKSMMNDLEAKITVSLIAILLNSASNYSFNGKIGVITPYKEQRRLISRELAHRFGPKILQSVEVSTVDGYQGQEKEVIIFSCVRTGDKSGIGFLSDSRRLNVAITRAKCSLFLLGKASTLVQNPLWRSLIEDAVKRKALIPFNNNFWLEQRNLALPPSPSKQQ